MNWIDAIVEMKNDNSKVFEFNGYKAKILDGKLLQYHRTDGWQVRGVFTKEQEADWVEVKQFKEVDYAEFMEWYCNPNNKGKKFKIQYKGCYGYQDSINQHGFSPDWVLSRISGFQIPNE